MTHRPHPAAPRRCAALGALALALALAATAHADIVTVQAQGEAPAEAADARVRAIDTALAEAVGRVLVDLVDAAERRRLRQEINRDIVRRARRFVAGFKVVEEGEAEGRLRVRIEARVDADALRDKLTALGAGDSAGQTRAGAPRPKLVGLVHEAAGETVRASFGERAGAERPGPAADALAETLAERGFVVASARGKDVPVSRELPEGVPLSDDAAAAIARAAGASGAVVAGVQASPDGAIRGTPLFGAVARATVRVLDVDGGEVSVVGRVQVERASFGVSVEEAMARAATSALEAAMDALLGTMVAYWPPMVQATGGAILVEVRGARDWAPVDALIDALSKTRGVARVWPRQLGDRGVVLAVETDLDRRRVASAIGRASLGSRTADVAAAGAQGLLVTISDAGESNP